MGTIAITEAFAVAGVLSSVALGEVRESSVVLGSVSHAPKPRGEWNPEFLIRQSGAGEIEFLPGAARASDRNREQGRLLFLEGVRLQKLAGAKAWREVWSQCSGNEESRLKRLRELRRGLAERKSINRRQQSETRKAHPDPFKLDRWDARLRELAPLLEEADKLRFSFSDRERKLWEVLEEIAREERVASGWKLKAQRQVACGLYGRQWDGQLCGARYFTRFHCRNRYCSTCGPIHHQDLLQKYLGLEGFVTGYISEHSAYGLKILDITTKGNPKREGGRMPDSAEVRQFKADVKKLVRRIARHLGVKVGYLYCLEFGFEENNLHCHGLLLSPYIEQALLSNWWREIRADGSFRVLVAAAHSFAAGLAHALEYTGKYSAPNAERAVELERAFHGCRRVDGLGLFFNRLPNEDRESVDVHCPCGDGGCFLRKRTDLGWMPIEYFERKGIPDLDVVRASRAGNPEAPRAGPSLEEKGGGIVQ